MTHKTLVQISKDLAAGDYSSRELTQDVIADIKARDSIYNSFISVSEDLALRPVSYTHLTLPTNREV